VRVELFETVEALAPHVDGWDALAVAAARPFSTPGWMLAWWSNLRPPGAQLRVMLVRDDERVVGVAPFWAEAATPGLARWRLLGSGVSERLEPLAERGLEPPVAAAFAAALSEARPRPSVVRFDGVPADSPWPGLLTLHWPGRARPWVFYDRTEPAPSVRLDGGDLESWLSGRSANFRKQMRQSRRRLDALGARFVLSEPEEIDRDVAAFARLHHERWTDRGGSGVMDPGVERMVADTGHALAAGDRFRLWKLNVEGRTISAHVFLAAGGELAWWLGGFDSEWAYHRPSLMTALAALEDAMRRGERRLDMGSGGQSYKYRFADGEDLLLWVHLVPPGIRYPVRRAQLALRRARRAAEAP
jgi:CelD/BcsL family acetyltransferase involved in cellulose biosynthesis